jgi:hypothetical protein
MFASTMMLDAATLAMTAMSPTKTCKVRVSSTRYRNDPYRARTNPALHQMTPVFRGKLARHPTPATQAPAVFAAPSAIMPLTSYIATAFSSGAATRAPSPVKQQQAHKPVAAAASSVPPAADSKVAHYVLVGFKHDQAMYQAPFRVSVGDVVIVEADRGEHIGVVQTVTTVKPKYNVPASVIRRASAAEYAAVDELTLKEEATAASIQKTAESVGLGIRICDVEFQLDMNKLTIFFASKCFVDFRKLQRALFREYRCRIWLVNWNEVNHYTPVPVNAAW